MVETNQPTNSMGDFDSVLTDNIVLSAASELNETVAKRRRNQIK